MGELFDLSDPLLSLLVRRTFFEAVDSGLEREEVDDLRLLLFWFVDVPATLGDDLRFTCFSLTDGEFEAVVWAFEMLMDC